MAKWYQNTEKKLDGSNTILEDFVRKKRKIMRLKKCYVQFHEENVSLLKVDLVYRNTQFIGKTGSKRKR